MNYSPWPDLIQCCPESFDPMLFDLLMQLWTLQMWSCLCPNNQRVLAMYQGNCSFLYTLSYQFTFRLGIQFDNFILVVHLKYTQSWLFQKLRTIRIDLQTIIKLKILVVLMNYIIVYRTFYHYGHFVLILFNRGNAREFTADHTIIIRTSWPTIHQLFREVIEMVLY